SRCHATEVRRWWAAVDSNHLPPRYQHGALPVELAARLWQGRKDSNPRPSVLETDALTRLSYAPRADSKSYREGRDPRTGTRTTIGPCPPSSQTWASTAATAFVRRSPLTALSASSPSLSASAGPSRC